MTGTVVAVQIGFGTGVVVDVKAGPFEYDSRLADDLVYLASAIGTDLYLRICHRLTDFKPALAFLTLVCVNRHRSSLTDQYPIPGSEGVV